MLIAVAAFVANAESATQAFAGAKASPIRKVEPQPAFHSVCGVSTSETAETAAVFNPEGVNPQRSYKAKLMPLRTIVKLFFGPSMTPQLTSFVQPMLWVHRNSRPNPKWPIAFVSPSR